MYAHDDASVPHEGRVDAELASQLGAADASTRQRILGAASRSVPDSLPSRPPAELVRRVTDGGTFVSFEPLGGDNFVIRAAAPVSMAAPGPLDARFVVATYDPPSRFAELTEAIDRSRSTYADVEALREPLKSSFRVTLTLVLLITMLAAICLGTGPIDSSTLSTSCSPTARVSSDP